MVIQKGSDLILELSVKPDKIRLYTTDTKVYIEITDFTDGKAYISADELRLLSSGVLAYTYYIGKADQSFDDNQYDTIGVIYTDYYLQDIEENGDIHGEATDEIKEYVDKVISDKTAGLDVYKEKTDKNSSDIGELNTELDNEIERALAAETTNANNIETETKRANSKENELDESIKTKADKTELVDYLTKDDAADQYQTKGDYALKTDIPTKTSELINDSGYLTENQLQDEFALKTDIPTKTSQLTNDSGYLTEHQDLSEYAKKVDYYTKTETDNKYQLQGDYVTYNEMSEELADYAKKTDIPTKTSELINDSGYLTEHQDISGKQDKLTDAQLANLNADHSKYVSSEYVTSIVKLTQSEYDALTTKDSSTIYLTTE